MADGDSHANGDGRKKPDTVLLIAGTLALLLSGSVLFGSSDFWMEWSLAAIAVFVGLILVVISMRRR